MTDPSFFFSFSFFSFFSPPPCRHSLFQLLILFSFLIIIFFSSREFQVWLWPFFFPFLLSLSLFLLWNLFFFSFSSWEAKVVMSLDSNLVFFLLVLSPSLYLSIFFFLTLLYFFFFLEFFFLVSKFRALFIFHWKWSADHLYVFFVFILPNFCLLKSFLFFISILFLFCHT